MIIILLRMYINHKGLSVSEIEVEVNLFFRIENQETITHIERKIIFHDELDEKTQQRLLKVAESCPVSKILKGSIRISTEVQ